MLCASYIFLRFRLLKYSKLSSSTLSCHGSKCFIPLGTDLLPLLENDFVNSKHATMWKEFCIKRCVKFIDFFPFFFKEKDKSSFLEVYRKYYYWNDIHFNAKGNKIIAERLIKEF